MLCWSPENISTRLFRLFISQHYLEFRILLIQSGLRRAGGTRDWPMGTRRTPQGKHIHNISVTLKSIKSTKLSCFDFIYADMAKNLEKINVELWYGSF